MQHLEVDIAEEKNTIPMSLIFPAKKLKIKSLPLPNLTKTRRLTHPKLTKPKGVTTQMKVLDEYILMVLFVLLLKRVHFLTNET